ncbi:hypothetical protein [Lascolabacillus sp.]|nr:hypothetical protein [Lascolabacillus sp.]MDD4759142.1 hypothetical protein [Lascolabacillus sp.]
MKKENQSIPEAFEAETKIGSVIGRNRKPKKRYSMPTTKLSDF